MNTSVSPCQFVEVVTAVSHYDVAVNFSRAAMIRSFRPRCTWHGRGVPPSPHRRKPYVTKRFLANRRCRAQPALDTLRDLVNFLNLAAATAKGWKDRSLRRGAAQNAWWDVELIGADMVTAYRMHDTPEKTGPMVKATFKGAGTRSVLLIAHMDTVKT